MAPPLGDIKQAKEGDVICPFIGNSIVPMLKPPSIANPGGRPEMIPSVQMWPCQEALCTMWDAGQGGCTVKFGFKAMQEIVPALAPLKNMFGGGS